MKRKMEGGIGRCGRRSDTLRRGLGRRWCAERIDPNWGPVRQLGVELLRPAGDTQLKGLNDGSGWNRRTGEVVQPLKLEKRIQGPGRSMGAVVNRRACLWARLVCHMSVDKRPAGPGGMHVFTRQHREREYCDDRADRHAESGSSGLQQGPRVYRPSGSTCQGRDGPGPCVVMSHRRSAWGTPWMRNRTGKRSIERSVRTK